MRIYTKKCLVLSTLHVRPETLNGGNLHHHIADYEEGAFFYVPHKADIDTDCQPDLAKVLEFAKSKGCTLIQFDRDGQQVEALPVYKWD